MSRELSSGDYVRALFVADEGHYLSVTRDEQVLAFESWPHWFDLKSQRQRSVFVGPRIPAWQALADHELTCETFIDERSVGRGGDRTGAGRAVRLRPGRGVLLPAFGQLRVHRPGVIAFR